MEFSALLNKYNIPVPRYTSYPTVPFWNEKIDIENWESVFKKQFQKSGEEGISLYIHLPFCESLCTYCGCNKKITANHNVEYQYAEALLKEWKMYRALMQKPPVLREIHLGGGTPTFFSVENLLLILRSVLADSIIPADRSFSFEGHPNNTTKEHLESLYELGFRRVSFGVQDNDPKVQQIINRKQPFENVINVTRLARNAGYESVNFDLIYGLPLQTEKSIYTTINECISLRPDRVAFYSYAHVPWTSRGQRLFDEKDLPAADLKLQLYQVGRKLFIENGYQDAGMDHFALPDDELCIALREGKLHRNFMGYTVRHTPLLLGLGVSAISDAGVAFAQNSKSLRDYYLQVENDKKPIEKGYFLNEEDIQFRKYILALSCNGKTFFDKGYKETIEGLCIPELEKLRMDGLVEYGSYHVQVTAKGRNFIRNICRAFDLHLLRNNKMAGKPSFSKAI